MPLGRLGFYSLGPLGSLSSQTQQDSNPAKPPTPPITPGTGITQEDDFFFLTENNDNFITD
jgi:hypothetical protein